jgi:hypothetical protein
VGCACGGVAARGVRTVRAHTLTALRYESSHHFAGKLLLIRLISPELTRTAKKSSRFEKGWVEEG